ncbi:uncharacterized protein LOC116986161 [Amblyraja radiata]|uniref:uncharacterized protein LOC116986161 n=1 Tax=Amblyraja radiata TaxID=386614 RepID=UPI0014023987|nr:uncharacterized protein LOC116986161 [Amblyraja radiata]
MAPLRPFIRTAGTAQEGQPSLLLSGSLAAGGSFLGFLVLAFLCNQCQRNNKEEKSRRDGVKLVGLSVGSTPQLRPVSLPEAGVRDPNRMFSSGDNGLRSWPASVDCLRQSGTELSEEFSENCRVPQLRELPNAPGSNYTGGKLVHSRKVHDTHFARPQVTKYTRPQSAVEDSLYESVGSNYEPVAIERQSNHRYGPNGREWAAPTRTQQGSKEPAANMDSPEYASIRKAKKKENNLNRQEKPFRRDIKNGCVLVPGSRICGEESRITENYADFSQAENFNWRMQGRQRSITDPDVMNSMGRTACGSQTEEQVYTNNVKGENKFVSKSHEKLHSMTDAEIAGMYSKVAKKAFRKGTPSPLNMGHRKDIPKLYSRSTGNINEEEPDYESIKSPHWHTGSQILGEKPCHTPVKERRWPVKLQEKSQDEEMADPGYEAIDLKWKRIVIAVGANRALNRAAEGQTENYYESISELQQSRACTSDGGREHFITGL